MMSKEQIDLAIAKLEHAASDPVLLSAAIEEMVPQLDDPILAGNVFRRLLSSQDSRIKSAILKSRAVAAWIVKNDELLSTSVAPDRPYRGPAIQVV